MAREHKLKAALDRQKGVNFKLERQKKLQKEARKRNGAKEQSGVAINASKTLAEEEEEEEAYDTAEDGGGDSAASLVASSNDVRNGLDDEGTDEDAENEEFDDDEDEDDVDGGIDLERIEDDSDSDSEDEELFSTALETNGQAEEDIPLSDIESLASEDRRDVIPHQRLTINNTAALERSLRSFALPSGLPFSITQSITSAEIVEITDVEDDLSRELAFYKQSLDAVKEARIQLKQEDVPFSRPVDYFAEMVKSEEQMGKVRHKMLDEAARKKASADARRQRDLKKFGKAVQVAKLQERDKAKRDTLDKINSLKRKRHGAGLDTNEDDLFDVALEDAAETEKKDRSARRTKGAEGAPNRKRQKKDEKYGFGGKKRFAKSNDAKSTSDMSSFSTRRMKNGGGGGGGGGKGQRPGKSRRAAGRR